MSVRTSVISRMPPEPRGVIVGSMQTGAEETVAEETDRCLFLVEHDLRGLSAWQLTTVHRALGEAVRRQNERGGRIRYVQCIYAPAEQRCLCLFEAAGPELVRRVNDIAQFPLARVMAVLSSVPDDAAT